jgi:phosphoribosyl 1,2-cyclic phosphodiesterase
VHIKNLGSAAGVGVVLTGGGLGQVLGLLQLRELKPIHIFASVRSARQMGHLPISRPGGSLERLAELSRPHKILVHINNTNPILDKDSPQYREVREDGWEFTLRQRKPLAF